MGKSPAQSAFGRYRHSLKLEREALQRLAESWPQDPQPESLYCEDRRALPKRRRTSVAKLWILDEALWQCLLITGNVVDHIVALEKCLAGDPPAVYSPMTLARAALDGAVRVCYVLDVRRPLNDRLLRGAALLLDSTIHEVAAIREIPAEITVPGAADTVLGARENVQDRIEAAGAVLRVGRDKTRVTGVAWESDGPVVNLKLNVTDEAKRYFEDLPAIYRMGSGVTHSTSWMLHDLDDEPSTVFMAGAAAISCLACCVKITQVYGQYYGHDPAPATVQGLRHCQGITAVMHRLSKAGFSSAGRYADEPRFQPPERKKKR